MKKFLIALIFISVIGFVLNIVSGFRIESSRNCLQIDNSLKGCLLNLETVERGYPVHFNSISGEDFDLYQFKPFGPGFNDAAFLGNQVFWTIVVGVLFASYRKIKESVGRAVLVGLVILAVLLYIGVLKLT